MKDAFGGAFILRIMIIFFVIFISFMVIAVNFAKTFRVKNNVINILERYNSDSKVVMGKVDDYLNDIHYDPAYSENELITKDCNNRIKNRIGVLKKINNVSSGVYDGICIVVIGDNSSYYFQVTSYMVFNTSFFNMGFAVPISGESRTINKIFN